MHTIAIRGARTHNLKIAELDLPRDQLIIFTGLSGSGKSSLAFDTLYAEGQRRYVESLSAYARQFLSVMQKPDVDHIEGLSPAISIEQKTASHNPRSTVGTITEIYDYLRLLYARVGVAYCPRHGTELQAQTVTQMVDSLTALPMDTRVMLLAPVVENRKGVHQQLLESIYAQGFVRARINRELVDLSETPKLALRQKHTIEVVVDRLKINAEQRQRLADSIETALKLSDGRLRVVMGEEKNERTFEFSAKYACSQCGYSLSELEPRLFSFNNPVGACSSCDGLGVRELFDPERIVHNPSFSLAQGAILGWDVRSTYYHRLLEAVAKHYKFSMDVPYKNLPKKAQKIILFGSDGENIHFQFRDGRGRAIRRTSPFEGVIPNFERRYRETESPLMKEEFAKFLSTAPCTSCNGARLKEEARNVRVGQLSLPQLVALPIAKAADYLAELQFSGQKEAIASRILREILARLQFLIDVGLQYLTLARNADSLSGGEAQRIRLASQIGAGLVGVMYVLDEPSIGLHQRDNERLLRTLFHLRDLGNTVIVVEHDEDAIRAADFVVDIGPGAGVHGGQVVVSGTPKDVMECPTSLTGQYLSGKRKIPVPTDRKTRDPNAQVIISGACGNNLKNINVEFPIGLLTCVTGVSGSGKSTLVNDTLYPVVAKTLYRSQQTSAPYESVSGLESFDKVIDIDQAPIGRTPRSNPATYIGLFTSIRELFAATTEARLRGYGPGRFSFNVKGGRCEACEGDGVLKVEMHFLADVYVTCDQCQGKRYNRETLEVLYKGKTISDVLYMTVEEAKEFFSAVPVIARKLQTLMDVGLSYVQLGQSATTLSGGEAQRVKLSKELSKRDTGRTLYLLDEPTTGLHFHDIEQLLSVLHRLRDQGNTIIIIEHNLDVIKTADWIIDLGPEGGDGGGEVIATGTPEEIAAHATSHTGRFLYKFLEIKNQKPAPRKQKKS